MLTGHNHYAMCARWHLKEDLIISASLDHTLRVWDFSALRGKYGGSQRGGAAQTSSELFFGSYDCSVKFVLEGHEHGVNWCAFDSKSHSNLIASCSDDRTIRLWK